MSIFTLEEAREVLPQVIDITDHYFKSVQKLKNQFEQEPNEERREDLIQQINYSFSTWVKEISSLGAEVKGPWLVDFDSGDGIYYCWKYGEDDIGFFHRYETGFKGRRPIEKLKGPRT